MNFILVLVKVYFRSLSLYAAVFSLINTNSHLQNLPVFWLCLYSVQYILKHMLLVSCLASYNKHAVGNIQSTVLGMYMTVRYGHWNYTCEMMCGDTSCWTCRQVVCRVKPSLITARFVLYIKTSAKFCEWVNELYKSDWKKLPVMICYKQLSETSGMWSASNFLIGLKTDRITSIFRSIYLQY
jgi:hypothetical protein